MLACRGDVVAGGKLLDDLDVGNQTEAGVTGRFSSATRAMTR
jgi:hypothetical protein